MSAFKKKSNVYVTGNLHMTTSLPNQFRFTSPTTLISLPHPAQRCPQIVPCHSSCLLSMLPPGMHLSSHTQKLSRNILFHTTKIQSKQAKAFLLFSGNHYYMTPRSKKNLSHRCYSEGFYFLTFYMLHITLA